LQKIKYKLEKYISEDAVYRKKKGERWNLEETTEEPDATNTEIAPPPSEKENLIEEPAPAPDINTLPEEENEESPDSQKTEGSVLGASTTAETNEKTDRVGPQESEYYIVFCSAKPFSTSTFISIICGTLHKTSS
jgi:hypothetical protein